MLTEKNRVCFLILSEKANNDVQLIRQIPENQEVRCLPDSHDQKYDEKPN